MVKKMVAHKPRAASKRRVAAAQGRKYGVIIRPMPRGYLLHSHPQKAYSVHSSPGAAVDRHNAASKQY